MEAFFLAIEDSSPNGSNLKSFGLQKSKVGDEFILAIAKREGGRVYFNLKPYGRIKKPRETYKKT